MSAFRTTLARCLLAVMLLTVFSPGFGWELVEGVAPHAHPVAAEMHEHDGHMAHDVMPGDSHAADECSGCDVLVAGDCGEQLHHCCPGHVLGHLPGSFYAASVAFAAPGNAFALDGAASRFSSRIPEGLERPPRAAA